MRFVLANHGPGASRKACTHVDGVYPPRAKSLGTHPTTRDFFYCWIPTPLDSGRTCPNSAVGNASPTPLLKVSDNPAITPVAHLGGSIFARPDVERADWAALYTRPRQEKALASDLAKLGVDYFLPLVTRIFVSGGRRRTVLHPLFPSYLFASLAEPNRLAVARTERIVQTIRPEPPQVPTFLAELQAIEAAVLTCPEQIELQPRVVNGTHARVTGGAMKGTEGLVVKSDNRSKIWLQVTTLGTGVLVEIEADLLEPAG